MKLRAIVSALSPAIRPIPHPPHEPCIEVGVSPEPDGGLGDRGFPRNVPLRVGSGDRSSLERAGGGEFGNNSAQKGRGGSALVASFLDSRDSRACDSSDSCRDRIGGVRRVENAPTQALKGPAEQVPKSSREWKDRTWRGAWSVRGIAHPERRTSDPRADLSSMTPSSTPKTSRRRSGNANRKLKQRLKTGLQWAGVLVLIVIFVVLWRKS